MLKLGAALDVLAILCMCGMFAVSIRTDGVNAPIYLIIIGLLVAGFVYLVKRIRNK